MKSYEDDMIDMRHGLSAPPLSPWLLTILKFVTHHPLNLGLAVNLYITIQEGYSSYLDIPFDPSKICDNKP